jgi:hypothetical protein
MTSPLSWVWLAQAVLLILVISSAVAGLLLLWQRNRPLEVHVLKHEVNITGAIKWGDANFAFPQLRGLSGQTPWPPP